MDSLVQDLEHLGRGPLDEEQVPQPPNDGPPLFDFFRLGQYVLAPVVAHAEENIVGQGIG